MLWPNRLSDAQGPKISTRHNSPSAALSRARAAGSSVLAVGSKDTVTLVSEVEMRSTDMPCCLNTWKASARNPT